MPKSTPPRSMRLRPALEKEISRIARRTRRPFSEVTQDLLEEALRMRQSPGVYFADEPGGRVAKVAGTGLAVWEVMRDDRAEGGTEAGLRKGVSDQEQLDRAAAQERALVTRNAHDFRVLASDRVQTQRPHAGIIVCPHTMRAVRRRGPVEGTKEMSASPASLSL